MSASSYKWLWHEWHSASHPPSTIVLCYSGTDNCRFKIDLLPETLPIAAGIEMSVSVLDLPRILEIGTMVHKSNIVRCCSSQD